MLQSGSGTIRIGSVAADLSGPSVEKGPIDRAMPIAFLDYVNIQKFDEITNYQ
jgi:hypothetical protein